MRALIITAHGSRNKNAARQVAALAAKIKEKAKGFDLVSHAFLQFSDPLLPDAMDAAVDAGAGQVVVFPFFIAAGSHLLTDIPEQVAAAAKAHPETAFSITRHLGGVDAVADLILDEVAAHLEGA